VILLDEDHVAKAEAMVLGAAAPNCVLLSGAQPGERFARIENHAARPGNGVDETTRGRRGRREELHKIERRTLAGENRAGRSRDFEDHTVRPDPVTVGGVPGEPDFRVQLAERRLDPGPATQNGVFAGNDTSPHRLRCGDELRGDVATANVLAERLCYLTFEISGGVVHAAYYGVRNGKP
jgi:hypothetical protein